MILFQTEQNHPFFQRGRLERRRYQGLDSLCLRRVLYLCERRDGTLDGNEGFLFKFLGFIWFGVFGSFMPDIKEVEIGEPAAEVV